MVKITFIEQNGREHSVPLTPGHTLMETAVRNNVAGIDADCGGACACATCHVFVDQAWQALIGPPSDSELSLIECLDNAQPNSRLSCQIIGTAQMDGLVLRMPTSQH